MIRLKYLKNYNFNLDSSCKSPNGPFSPATQEPSLITDVIGNNVDVVIWSDIETYTAIICSCLMCLRPLLKKCFPSLFPPTRNEFQTQTLNEYSNSSTQPFDGSLASTMQPQSRGGNGDDNLKSSNLSFQSRSLGAGYEVWDEGDAHTMIFHETGDRNARSGDYELEERGVTSCTLKSDAHV